MDLIKILRDRINVLDPGDHTPGLRAILQHIEVAAKHMARGAATSDDTAFTDTIYRTNQAFEGALKEAYRVLASADPSHKSPFEIENYFVGNSVFRQRVVDQFSTYRKEWRNPSTHDYKLDFDEDEALLAIVSVCAFAIVLIDQIASKLSYNKAATMAPAAPQIERSQTLIESVASILLEFQPELSTNTTIPRIFESEVIGAIAGLISKAMPDAKVAMETRLSPSAPERVDLLVEWREEKLLVEVKRAVRSQKVRAAGLDQVSRYIEVSGINDAILYFFDERGREATAREDYKLPGTEKRILIIQRPPKTETA